MTELVASLVEFFSSPAGQAALLLIGYFGKRFTANRGIKLPLIDKILDWLAPFNPPAPTPAIPAKPADPSKPANPAAPQDTIKQLLALLDQLKVIFSHPVAAQLSQGQEKKAA